MIQTNSPPSMIGTRLIRLAAINLASWINSTSGRAVTTGLLIWLEILPIAAFDF